MEITTLKGFILISIALVPGFIFGRVKRRFAIFDEPTQWQYSLLYYLVHSLCLMAAIWPLLAFVSPSPAVLITSFTGDDTAFLQIAGYQWLLALLVWPAVAGFFAAMATRYEVLRRLFRFRWLYPLPSLFQAWDRAFLMLNSGESYVVLLKLKNGDAIVGLFDGDATVSRTGAYKDVYLSKVCDIEKDGRIVYRPNSAGIFVQGSGIVHIQFLHLEDQAHAVDQHIGEEGGRHG